ncbi:12048_t:CDS:10 [Funneliformis geosporum]|uniref:12048_t:CDS:1 n=1 Tax=Funneliformis geosporum TaxID=1117311 RepID=A0A9W4SBE7_9GLOM|nr:12048_t:CDS:10 [Funneliformis geosporum]
MSFHMANYQAGPTVPKNHPKGGYTGINEATSFVDASTIYGNNDTELKRIRDYGNNGKMRLEIDYSTSDGELGYPLVDEDGRFILGYGAIFRNVFTDLFHVILLREHNRLCDEFFAVHGNDWNDEQYFQEARRWGYKPDLKPEINTFFATVTYRYGHSEVSLDTVRSRDRGIPLYNDAREAFGLTRKSSWAEISSDLDVQKRLEDTYGTVDRVEALMGGLAEDHINGGNYGELFYKSFSEQWKLIRDSDRFWYENQDAGFSQEDIAKIKTTTLLDILIRNSPKSSLYPQNLCIELRKCSYNFNLFRIGITIFSITIIQISLGIMAIWGLANVESAATGIVRNLKHLHIYLGGILLLAAWVNIFFGMHVYGANKAFVWAYVVWLVFFGFVITTSEFYYKIKNMQFLWPIRETNDATRRLHNCIPEEIFENLPVITLNEFNNRVMTGANLVIAEGLVFDIHRWIPVHPGGQRILKRVVGTDITRDFFFDPADQIVISNNSNDYDVPRPSISVLTDNTHKEKTCDAKIKPQSVANAVEMINSKSFKNRRVAMHRHSKFATSKLASMVTARIKYKQIEISDEKEPLMTLLPPNQPPNQPLHCNIFRRYILTNIEFVTRQNSENPVKKFTFQVIHQNDTLPRFLPGDYIEIMSFTNNQVTTRLYTPVQGPNENSFCIFVKIYKDGIMSQYLNKQLKNFEIKARGPFDIADRISQVTSSPSLKPDSINSRPSSPTYLSSNNARIASGMYNNNFSIIRSNSINTHLNLLDGRSGILLNKVREDLCWDYLFMVCGGTGITPMLQLIQYHMDKASTSNSDFKLFLLVANDTIADLICPKYLDYLCQVLKGKLKITYILLKPPPIWNDLSGLIDDTKLYDWICQNYSVPPPAIPPRLNDNYTQNYNLNAHTYYSNNPNNHNNLVSNMYDDDQMHQQQRYDDCDKITSLSRKSSSSSPSHVSPISIPMNEMLLMNEKHNYMKQFAMDNSKQVKLIVCGSNQFNENIRKSLQKLGYPIEEKAVFIN